jgi:protein-S-isoprenylcysteine O-methyltransferase Ste14
MKSNRTKGRTLASIQFVLLFLIIASAIIEKTHHEGRYSVVINVISIALMIIGIVTLIMTIIEFRQYMTPNPVPLDNAQLRTGGIYSFVRHPMYLSVILLAMGGTLYLKAYLTLALDMIAILFLIYKISFEEKMLTEKYAYYKEYQKKTKKLIPFIF